MPGFKRNVSVYAKSKVLRRSSINIFVNRSYFAVDQVISKTLRTVIVSDDIFIVEVVK